METEDPKTISPVATPRPTFSPRVGALSANRRPERGIYTDSSCPKGPTESGWRFWDRQVHSVLFPTESLVHSRCPVTVWQKHK